MLRYIVGQAVYGLRTKLFVLPVLLSLLLVLPASATQYYVDNTNANASDTNAGTSQSLPWKTLAKAASTLVAGDTVNILAGSYDERVTPTNSGTPANPITYQASVNCVPGGTCPKLRAFTLTNKNYITVTGLELTSSGFSTDANALLVLTATTGVRILNNYIHDTISLISIAIVASPSGAKASGLLFKGNTITAVGPHGGHHGVFQFWGDDSLIEENDISHTASFSNVFGSRNVVRNNTWHDSSEADSGGAHMAFMQTFCAGTPAQQANYLLMEGNRVIEVRGLDSKFAIIRDPVVSCGGSTSVIFRYNVIYNLGGVFSDNLDGATFHKLYNNTVVHSGADGNLNQTSNMSGSTAGVGCTTCSILNNIFVDAISPSSTFPSMYIFKTGDSTSKGDYNMAYMTTGNITWAGPIANEGNGVLNQDPLFASNTDFHFKSGSRARKTGGPLTKVATSDSGSGTSLVVEDAHFFQDGWAGVSADWIAVGNTRNTVQISSINYSTNTITLASPITRSAGQPVWLYKDSNGATVLYSIAPDRGALPFPEPFPPTNLKGTITP